MPRKAKPGSSRYYFTDDTEKAIVRFNNSDNQELKDKIYLIPLKELKHILILVLL